MITIVAKSTVKKECITKFKVLANQLVQGSQKESGCQEYGMYQDTNNPQILTFIEKWIDRSAIEVHNKSDHYINIVPKLNMLREIPVEVNKYERVED